MARLTNLFKSVCKTGFHVKKKQTRKRKIPSRSSYLERKMMWKEWHYSVAIKSIACVHSIFIQYSRFQLQLIRCTCWKKKYVSVSDPIENAFASIKKCFIQEHFHRIVDESQFRQMAVIKINQDLRCKRIKNEEKNWDHAKTSISSQTGWKSVQKHSKEWLFVKSWKFACKRHHFSCGIMYFDFNVIASSSSSHFLSSSFLLRCNGKNETDSNALKLHQTLEQVFWEHEFSLMIALNRLFFSGFCANTNYCAIHSNPVFIEKKRRHSVVNSLQVQQKPEKFNRQKKNANRCFFLIFV